MSEWLGIAEFLVGLMAAILGRIWWKLSEVDRVVEKIRSRPDGTTPMLDRIHGKMKLIEHDVESLQRDRIP